MILSENYSIPDRIVREVAEYDPLLRIRWGRREGIVRVERKVVRGWSVDPSTVADFDDGEAIRDGYVLVFKFPPLEHNYYCILPTLAHGDIHRRGGAEYVDDNLTASEQYAKERRKWNRQDDFRHMGADLYRVMNTVRTSPEGAGWRKNKSFKD